MSKYGITFIGHMCYDQVTLHSGETITAPGSAVMCGAMVTAKVGVKTAAVVKMSLDEVDINKPMEELGVDVFVVPAECTTFSKVLHKSENVDER
ncbi:MAG: hypothetical protein FWB92_12220, partial [Oscillospiraceae bacterium]|nr:hypothetical protein [Oscillospiraceae bacterium]